MLTACEERAVPVCLVDCVFVVGSGGDEVSFGPKPRTLCARCLIFTRDCHL